MQEDNQITATTSVREVMTRYPHTEVIFNKYGLTGCGGRKGPQEPVGFFATVHHVDPDQLLKELNDAVTQAPAVPPAATSEVPAEEPDIYRPFVKTALAVVITVGCTLGAINLAAMALAGVTHTYWEAVTQAHGHAQIFGWVGLFIMGVAYHVLPRLKASPLHSRGLALASYWLVLSGISLRMVAQPFAGSPELGGIVVLSAAAEVAGAVLFAYVAVRTLTGNPETADFWDKYVVASAVWFVVSAAGLLGISVYMAGQRLAVIPASLNVPYLHASLVGFAGMMILGITLRTIPVFMGLRSPNKAAFGVIFWALNASIATKVAAGWAGAFVGAGSLETLVSAATMVEYASIVAFVLSLGVLGRPERDVSAEGVNRGYERFVRAAYFWLLVAGTMSALYAAHHLLTGQQVPHSFVGAYRHALTVGFISMIIVGMAARIIPVFTGVRLHSDLMLLATFVLVNVGNTVRVISQPLADIVGGPFLLTMGVSGFVEVTGLGLFVYNIWRTIDSPVEDDLPVTAGSSDGTIGQHTIVADVLNRYPGALDVFVRHGFTQLRNPVGRRTLARAVTVEEACRIKGADLAALLEDLNRSCVQPSQACPTEDRKAEAPRPESSGPRRAPLVPFAVTAGGAVSRELVTMALRSVEDPEIPVNIVDLGLVQEVRITGGDIEVDLILTAPGCPMGDQMVAEVRDTLAQLPGVDTVRVSILDEPEWTPDRMSDGARAQLGMRVAS